MQFCRRCDQCKSQASNTAHVGFFPPATDRSSMVRYGLGCAVFCKQSSIMIGFYMRGFRVGVGCARAATHFLMFGLDRS